MSVLCRRAGRRDLGSLQLLWCQARSYEHKVDAHFDITRDAESVAREHHELILSDPRSGFFVAEERGEVLGYLHAQIETGPLGSLPTRYGEVVDLIVFEGRRREGIARRLLEYCRDWFDGQGVDEFRVTLPVNSEPAHRLFGAEGARPRTVTYLSALRPAPERPEQD